MRGISPRLRAKGFTIIECWKFNDPRTIALNNFCASTPGDPDLVRFQGVLGF
jgi:hypothetical protein